MPRVCPSRLADVITVSLVVEAPPFGVTLGGSKLHVIPVMGGQERATGSANPPVGIMATSNTADWPAVIVEVGGVALKEKSRLAMVTDTCAEILLPNFSSPE